jgi:hypothetical protein
MLDHSWKCAQMTHSTVFAPSFVSYHNEAHTKPDKNKDRMNENK